MIRKFVLAVVIAIGVWLGLVALLGPLLLSMHVPPATVVGNFFVAYGYVIAILFGIWFFFAGPDGRFFHRQG